MKLVFFLVSIFAAVCCVTASLSKAEVASFNSPHKDHWVSLFDGKTLKGWTAEDMSFWSVEDGAITGTVTAEHKPPRLQFIVCQAAPVSDFQMKFKFRVFGEKANSGMQFRSRLVDGREVHGYQADIARTGAFLGGIWDEFSPRGSLAARGQLNIIDETGKKSITKFADPETVLGKFVFENWNAYEIKARGSHMTLKINGKTTAELDDREAGKSASSGIFAMAVIPEPMKVQFKDIRVRELSK